MMATGSPRARARGSPAKPATRGVPPRISTFTTATSAESATPTRRPGNHCRLPENLIAMRRGCRVPSSPTRMCRLVTSVPCESAANAVPLKISLSENCTTSRATAS